MIRRIVLGYGEEMAFGPEPLAPGVRLCERYTIAAVLGQGGFGITYLVDDAERRDRCTIKELAPAASKRLENGLISFDAIGEAAARQLRHQFTREAKVLRGLKIPGVPAVRDMFEENATAYFACEWVAHGRSLDSILSQTGRMSEEEVRDFLAQIANILSAVHQQGTLHRDLKPSNILIDPDGRVHLIDFGSARAWHQDLTVAHTVQYTPGYAPPEQLSERGRRSPATDIYGLCATAYAMLAGEPPPPSTDRLAGVPLIPIEQIRSEISPELAQSINRGLAWRMTERPPTITALLEILGGGPETAAETLEDLDRRKALLSRLRFGKRECPACHGVLESPKPSPLGTCIVCRSGKLGSRDIPARRCAVCRTGTLHAWSLAKNGPRWCPVCRFGELHAPMALPWKPRTWTCGACNERFTDAKGEVARLATGDQGTWSEWLAAALRSEASQVCDACAAQFDEQTDGRWRLIHPRPKTMGFRDLYPDEWARVAANLAPDQGNAVCLECGADYFVEPGHLTLLDSAEDPYGAREEFLGVRLDDEAARWVAVGKLSGNLGLVCGDCGTEFDTDAESSEWTLFSTAEPDLREFVGDTATPENWHRRGNRLPDVGDEAVLDEQLGEAVRRAYQQGDLAWGAKRGAWASPASWVTVDDTVTGTITIDDSEIAFGGLLRKRRLSTEGIKSAKAHGDELTIVWEDGSEAVFAIDPQTLTVPLTSGNVEFVVSVRDLAKRLARR